jgi:hypothetical protein
MNPARLGRILAATLVAPHLDTTCEAYARHLHLRVAHWTHLTPTVAGLLRRPDLAGARCAWLEGSGGLWLRVVEGANARLRMPMRRHGWLALEVLVGDVDRLAAELAGSPFRVIGPPADLDVSPKIRACQVTGPCGELLYLTQVKEPVPPFELPLTRAPVDRPFVAVLSTPSREATRSAWETLAARMALSFDTKITVLNRVFGRPLTERYPVSVLQMRDQCLIEMDEVDPRWIEPADAEPAGLRAISIACGDLDALAPAIAARDVVRIEGVFYGGRRVAGWRSPDGAQVELIEST